jgi:hypothetical protein
MIDVRVGWRVLAKSSWEICRGKPLLDRGEMKMMDLGCAVFAN